MSLSISTIKHIQSPDDQTDCILPISLITDDKVPADTCLVLLLTLFSNKILHENNVHDEDLTLTGHSPDMLSEIKDQETVSMVTNTSARSGSLTTD